jgi:hypothetical protein
VTKFWSADILWCLQMEPEVNKKGVITTPFFLHILSAYVTVNIYRKKQLLYCK